MAQGIITNNLVVASSNILITQIKNEEISSTKMSQITVRVSRKLFLLYMGCLVGDLSSSE